MFLLAKSPVKKPLIGDCLLHRACKLMIFTSSYASEHEMMEINFLNSPKLCDKIMNFGNTFN